MFDISDRPRLPVSVRSKERLTRILLAKGAQHDPNQKCDDDQCAEAERSTTEQF